MRDALTLLFGLKLPAPLEGTLERLLVLDRFNDLYEQVRKTAADDCFLERFLESMNVRPKVSASDLSLVPKEGPVVAVANHPFGLIEGAILGSLLAKVRPDVKVMANHLLAALPEARRYCVFVNPFGGQAAVRSNQSGLKDSISWVKRGGLLAVFPAGEVAHLNLKEGAVTDPEWNRNIARLIRLTGATALPIYFLGANSALFHLLGLLHPRVRTALLAHEFLNKNDRDIELRIGSPISPAKVQRYQDDLALVRYLRHRTYLLRNRDTRGPRRIKVLAPCPSNVDGLMAAEVAQLSPGQTLLETEEFLVLLAKAHQIPNVLHEIGRLREITFRDVGEGTGQAIDLDTFDDHYWHLFLWHRAAQQVVGAYRVGPSDEIVASVGVRGLYTWQLFAWKPSFLERIGPALELGRSFVRREYQRTYAPLLLLWRGIGQFLVGNPRYKVLFGPVSISTDYGTASRQLMVQFLREYRQSPELAPMVRARNPFRTRPFPVAQELVKESAWDIEELSSLVSDIDFDRKGVPVLLKQYLRLGGELVAFNVDRNFANALDGLIVVDLRKTDLRLLVRYLGEEGAATFLAQ
jgi:putative hemolysin